MSKELNMQSGLNDACNYIDKIVGRYVHNYEQRVSKHEARDGYLISLSADCRHQFCRFKVLAKISTTEEKWSSKLVHFFIQRAEFHAKVQHHIVTDFLKVPKTRPNHKQSGGRHAAH